MVHIKKKKILIAGASGYLGRHVVEAAIARGYDVRLLVRTKKQKKIFFHYTRDIHVAQVTEPLTLSGLFDDVDVVFSSIGITRQKDNLTYMDVDYQANLNLLNLAAKNNVRKFIYTSVFNPQALEGIKIIQAKELFVKRLKESQLEYCIIRPTGFFCDLKEVLTMANKGPVYLIGNGLNKVNPISGRDLAQVCCNSITSNENVINVGGPNVYTMREITNLAFKALNKPQRTLSIPTFIVNFFVFLIVKLTSSKFHGPIEFFSKAITLDMVAPKYGQDDLLTFFEKEAIKIQNKKNKN